MVTKIQSISSIGKYMTCARLYDLHYNHNIREEPKHKDAMDRGSCVHAGLEAYLKSGNSIAAALDAAASCEDPTVSPEIRLEACEILSYYLPKLYPMTPVIYNGVPLVEFEFEEYFTSFGVGLKGKIDAVVRFESGEVAMIDWKTRANSAKMYREYPLQIDKQLPVYAAVLKHKFGVVVDSIYQVQMSSEIPSKPKLYAGKKALTAADYQDKLGKTTSDILQEAAQAIPESERPDFFMKFFPKVETDEYFLRYTPINVANIDMHLRLTLKMAQKIEADNEMLPILDTYKCQYCELLKPCMDGLGLTTG